MEIEQVDEKFQQEFERRTGDNWVVVSNALNRAAHGLNLPERRIMWFAVSKLDSRTTLNTYDPVFQTWAKRESPVISVSAQELVSEFDIDLKSAYAELQKGTQSLMRRTIKFQRKNTKTGKPVGVEIQWAKRADYHYNEGRITIRFSDDVLPHLWFQKKQFTKIQMRQVAQLRTKYSWKLEALFSQVSDQDQKGVLNVEIDDFNHAMEATEKQKEDFAAIRRRIIEPAVKELIEKNNWLINWDFKKRGRKVSTLVFKFAKNPQERMF